MWQTAGQVTRQVISPVVERAGWRLRAGSSWRAARSPLHRTDTGGLDAGRVRVSVAGVERSAGVLVYRWNEGLPHGTPGELPEVLLGHLGGPYWSRKDEGAWTIPKGLVEVDEDDWAAARREFEEETGQPVPDGTTIDLGVTRQNRGKEIHIWAVPGAIDAAVCASNYFEMEWPPKSGRVQEFPELDRFAWLDLRAAEARIVQGQKPVLTALATRLASVDRRPNLDTSV